MSRLHKPEAGFWIRACVMLLYPIDSLLFRIRWRGLDRVPAPDRGGVIIAINHISHIDTILMARLIWQSGRVPRFMIKSSLFDKPVLGTIFRGARQIPVYRGTADAADSLRDAVTALRAGECIVIYPEGTITRDPEQWPMQARTGIARLWQLAPEIPVVPVGQWGAQQRRGPRRRSELLRRRTSRAIVGSPVDLARFADDPRPEAVREVTDAIMTSVRDLVAELRDEQPPAQFYELPMSPATGGRHG